MGDDVAAGLPDGGEDFGGDPLLEGFGFGFAGAKDEGVQAGFGDERHQLESAGGHQFDGPFLVTIEVSGEVCRGQAERIAHVLRHEPRIVALHDDAEVAGEQGGVTEDGGGGVVGIENHYKREVFERVAERVGVRS